MNETHKKRQPKSAKAERRLAALSRAGFKHALACVANRARSPFVNVLLRPPCESGETSGGIGEGISTLITINGDCPRRSIE